MSGISLAFKVWGVTKRRQGCLLLIKRGEMQNIIDLETVRQHKAKLKTQAQYLEYIKTLSLAQLESEANHLLEEFSEQTFGDDYTLRVQSLLGHMAERAEGSFKEAIQGMTQSFEL
jgi:hypothetical protein